MPRAKKLPQYVLDAIKCGPVPKLRNWKTLPTDRLTKGEMVLRFAYDHLRFPEGSKAGEPLELDIFQQAFILAAFDAPHHVKKSILSMARRGGKTLVMAVICLAYVIGPLAKQNTLIRSAAMTREQAGLLWRLMNLTCQMSPDLENLYRSVPSSKKIVGLNKNVEYQSLSRDAKSGHGQAIYVLVVDECGQIDAPNDDFLDMLFSSQGTYEDARSFLISTQAPSDAAFFSLELDTAEREQPINVISHIYTAPTEDLHDEKNWYAANPSLYGGYRSKEDIRTAAEESERIPAKQSGFLNLYLNRRVSRESIWLAPSVWKENAQPPSFSVFHQHGVVIGLDLSQRNDLTVACIAAKDDDGFVHVYPYAFTPEKGIEDRGRRDKVPYAQWARDEIIRAVPGATIDYEWVAQFLRINILDEGIAINSIEFDRWRIREFQSACDRQGLTCYNFHEVGQGYQSMSPRIEAMETALLQNKIRHGAHPIFNLGAAHAIATQDPSGNRKLDKAKASQKIDGLVAMLMAIYPLVAQTENDLTGDVSWLVG